MHKNYLFSSTRLGFRNWLTTDLPQMAEINADKRVMEFFPSIQTIEETQNFIIKMQQEFKQKGFCYYAVDELETEKFIGFIGLHLQTFESDFTPCIDIGWRLHPNYWNNGYATEGAERCLRYAFNTLKLERVKAMAPIVNIKSINVMKKLVMKEIKNFDHPALLDNELLKECALFEIAAHDFVR